jgi:tetratricopeptide (TPR) repeat protein
MTVYKRPDVPTRGDLVARHGGGAARHWPVVGLLLVATIMIYWPVKDHELSSYDDYGNVINNPYFDPLTLRNVSQVWRVPYFGTYAPVTYSFFAAEAWLAKRPASEGNRPPFDPRVFHLGNLALHALGVLLVFVLLKRLSNHALASACGALVFAAHPCQAEPVGWVTETKTLLAGVFAFAALLEHLNFAEPAVSGGRGGAQRDKRRWMPWVHYGVATVFFALAMLAKASAAAVPLIALALDTLWLRQSVTRSLRWLSPWFLGALALAVATKGLQTSESFQYVAAIWKRPLIFGDALAFYLMKLVVPIRLSADYGRSPEYVLRQNWTYIAWLIPLTLCGVLAWKRVDRRYWAALAIALAALLPVSGLIPFGFQDISTVADRYLHLPLFGVALGITWFLANHWRTATIVPVLLVALAFGAQSWWQVQAWRDDETLARRGLAVNPRSQILRQILGSALARQGRGDEALAQYREAARLHPQSLTAHIKLARILEDAGQADEALAHYQQAVALQPDSADARRHLAAALAKQGRRDEAIEHYQRALIGNPTPRPVHLGMASLYREMGRADAAIPHYQAALAWQTEDAKTWMALGGAYEQCRDWRRAAAAFREAVRIAPDETAGYLQLGNALLRLNEAGGAIDAFRQAVRLRPGLTVAHQNLAVALAGQGLVAEAINHLQAVLQAAPADPNANFSIGILLGRQSRWDESIRRLGKAVEVRPDWIEARLALANTLASAGRVDEAVQAYQEALRLNPNQGQVHSGLGRLLAKLGRKQEAIDHLTTAITLEPTDREAQAVLKELGAATSLGPANRPSKREG